MDLHIEVEREEDGRWIAEVQDLPGVMAYGHDENSAVAKVHALAIRVLAEREEQGREPYLTARARRATRERYDAALAEAPDAEPEEYDRLAATCAHLNAAEERALAEEGVEADFAAWLQDPDLLDNDADALGGEEDEITARLDRSMGQRPPVWTPLSAGRRARRSEASSVMATRAGRPAPSGR